METMEMFQEIVREANILDIPTRYITAVTMLDDAGVEQVITGEDISTILKDIEPYRNSKQVNLMFDLRLLAYDVVILHSDLFTYIYDKMDESNEKPS